MDSPRGCPLSTYPTLTMYEANKTAYRGNMEREYRCKSLPRDKEQIQKLMSEMTRNKKIIHINTAYDYMILRECGAMKNKKTYVVKELPNSSNKIEELLNKMHNIGYELLHMNDYSCTFIKKSFD